jgi:uncharacterized protein (DUF2141 family)
MLLAAAPAGAFQIAVEINNLRSNDGVVGIVVFDRAEGFPTKGEKARFRAIVKPERGRVTAAFAAVPFGTYAIAVVHDENNNGTLDTSWIGRPIEGYGSSNNPAPRMGPPRFEDARFTVTVPHQVVNIRMVYP